MSELADEMKLSHADKRAAAFEDRLESLKRDLRDEIGDLNDPQAKALFETTAEAIGGLQDAFEDYRAKTEEAWEASSPVAG